MFYWKIELCIVRMGDNDICTCTYTAYTACTLEMVDHVILELQIKEVTTTKVPLDKGSIELSFGTKIERWESTS